MATTTAVLIRAMQEVYGGHDLFRADIGFVCHIPVMSPEDVAWRDHVRALERRRALREEWPFPW